MTRRLSILLAAALAGCGGAEPRRVAVPDRDATPPHAVVALGSRAEAAIPGDAHAAPPVRLERPLVPARTVGRDPESGVARVRISLLEHLTCRDPSGRAFRERRVRYLPPPQVERIRAAPGASLETERSRARVLALSRGRCGAGATLERVEGELWGEAINGLGLEAVTPHIRFSYSPSAARSAWR